jgi:DNA-binding transcriptional MerR regulator
MESFTLKEVQLRFNVPQHVLIHLCEKGVIIPEISDPQGRGKSRKFSLRNIFEFAVALELRKYELPIARIKALLQVVTHFEKHVRKTFSEFSLPRSLQESKTPFLCYLFNGDLAAFDFGKVIVSFNLTKLLDGDSKRIQAEAIKELPSSYASYLRIDLQKLARES